MVRQPLVFDLDALSRYRMVTRVGFTECGGNSAPLFSNEPIQADVQALHEGLGRELVGGDADAAQRIGAHAGVAIELLHQLMWHVVAAHVGAGHVHG